MSRRDRVLITRTGRVHLGYWLVTSSHIEFKPRCMPWCAFLRVIGTMAVLNVSTYRNRNQNIANCCFVQRAGLVEARVKELGSSGG